MAAIDAGDHAGESAKSAIVTELVSPLPSWMPAAARADRAANPPPPPTTEGWDIHERIRRGAFEAVHGEEGAEIMAALAARGEAAK